MPEIVVSETQEDQEAFNDQPLNGHAAIYLASKKHPPSGRVFFLLQRISTNN